MSFRAWLEHSPATSDCVKCNVGLDEGPVCPNCGHDSREDECEVCAGPVVNGVCEGCAVPCLNCERPYNGDGLFCSECQPTGLPQWR